MYPSSARTHGGEILGVRKQDRPAVADPFVKVDRPWVVSAVKLGASELIRRDMFIPRESLKLKDARRVKPHCISRDRISSRFRRVNSGGTVSAANYGIGSAASSPWPQK